MVDNVCLEDANTFTVGEYLHFTVNRNIEGKDAGEPKHSVDCPPLRDSLLRVVLQHSGRFLDIFLVDRSDVDSRVLNCPVKKAEHCPQKTNRNFLRFEKLQQCLQRTERARLDVNSLGLLLDRHECFFQLLLSVLPLKFYSLHAPV